MRILGREGAYPRVYGMFFKVVVQAVLVLGLETWVLTPCMERSLVSFQHRFARRITGRHLRRRRGGVWEYPPLASAMEETRFEEIRVYIQKRQNTFVQYISTQPIMDLCDQSIRRLGGWFSWRCW